MDSHSGQLEVEVAVPALSPAMRVWLKAGQMSSYTPSRSANRNCLARSTTISAAWGCICNSVIVFGDVLVQRHSVGAVSALALQCGLHVGRDDFDYLDQPGPSSRVLPQRTTAPAATAHSPTFSTSTPLGAPGCRSSLPKLNRASRHARWEIRRRGNHRDYVMPSRWTLIPPGRSRRLGARLEAFRLSQIFRFSDFSIQAAFSRPSIIWCSRSAVEGSAASTSSWTRRMVPTVA